MALSDHKTAADLSVTAKAAIDATSFKCDGCKGSFTTAKICKHVNIHGDGSVRTYCSTCGKNA